MTIPEEKLNWIFGAFDADGGGSIDVEEIREIVVWMFRFAGIDEDPDLLESCVIDVRYWVFQLEIVFHLRIFILLKGQRENVN
jgi:hypothetical protein